MCVLQQYTSSTEGMGVRKGTVVLFVPTLFGCFLGIPSLYVFSFSKMLFCDCNVGEDGHRSAQQGRYRFLLMHITEDSMFYSGPVLLEECSYYYSVATATHFGSIIKRIPSIIIV